MGEKMQQIEIKITETFARLLAIKDQLDTIVSDLAEFDSKSFQKEINKLKTSLLNISSNISSNFDIIEALREEFDLLLESYAISNRNVNIAQKAARKLNLFRKKLEKINFDKLEKKDIEELSFELDEMGDILNERYQLVKIDIDREKLYEKQTKLVEELQAKLAKLEQEKLDEKK